MREIVTITIGKPRGKLNVSLINRFSSCTLSLTFKRGNFNNKDRAFRDLKFSKFQGIKIVKFLVSRNQGF
jgi:hypothetical protein